MNLAPSPAGSKSGELRGGRGEWRETPAFLPNARMREGVAPSSTAAAMPVERQTAAGVFALAIDHEQNRILWRTGYLRQTGDMSQSFGRESALDMMGSSKATDRKGEWKRFGARLQTNGQIPSAGIPQKFTMADKKRTASLDWEDVRFFSGTRASSALSPPLRAPLKVTHATVSRRLASLEATLRPSLVHAQRARLHAERRRRVGCSPKLRRWKWRRARSPRNAMPRARFRAWCASPSRAYSRMVFSPNNWRRCSRNIRRSSSS